MVEIEMKDEKKKRNKRKRTTNNNIISSKRKVPVLPWMRNPIDISKFKDCELDLVPFLDPRLEEALQRMGISCLFPVQVAVWQETIGPGAFERDLCINAPTGTGKTLAYALPIVQKLSTRAVKCIRALVVVPNRDLALQVKEVFAAIAPAVGLSVGLAVGQTPIEDEISELIKRPNCDAGICYDPEDHGVGLQSSVDILVATPGRLMDHINTTKGFTLEHLCYLVVDETDRLLREAYQSWLPTVLHLTNTNEDDIFPLARTFAHSMLGSLKTIRKSGVEKGCKGKTSPRLMKMMLSATLTRDPSKLSQLDLYHPLFLTTGPQRYQLPEKLECYKLICTTEDRPLYLVALLQDLKGEKCIVFSSSVKTAKKLHTLLNAFELPFKIMLYSGRQHQSVRSKTLKAFRMGDAQVLVASDALTRGMDVEGVRTVINIDVPSHIKKYVHRAGRTARAGQAGRCFSILRKEEVTPFKDLLQKAGRNTCSVYPLPAGLIESFRPQYTSVLEKLVKSSGNQNIKIRQDKVPNDGQRQEHQ